MRFFFTGPRILGIRPGISFGPNDFRRWGKAGSSSTGTMTGSFIYVVQGAGNHHNIGVSTDPIAQLSKLQIGSRQALDFVYIGVTPGDGVNIEQAAGEMLASYRRSGGWFAVPASIAIGTVIECAKRLGEPIQQVTPEMVPQIIHLANQPAPAPRSKWWGILAPLPAFIRWPLMVLFVAFSALVGVVFAFVLSAIVHS